MSRKSQIEFHSFQTMVLLSFFFNSKVECFFIAIFSKFDIGNLERPWAVGRSTRFTVLVRFAKRRISREGTWKVRAWKIVALRKCDASSCISIVWNQRRLLPLLSMIELRIAKKFWNFVRDGNEEEEKNWNINFPFADRPRVIIILVLVDKARHDFSESLAVS